MMRLYLLVQFVSGARISHEDEQTVGADAEVGQHHFGAAGHNSTFGSALGNPSLVAAGQYCSNHLEIGSEHGFGYSLETCASAVRSESRCQSSFFYFSASYNGQCKCALDDCSERGSSEAHNIYQLSPPPAPPPSFPNLVFLRNGESDSKLLVSLEPWYPGRSATSTVAAEDPVEAPPNGLFLGLVVAWDTSSWAIRQHEGTPDFTICNPHSCACLFANDAGAVGVTTAGFQDNQLWMIDRTDDGKYTVTHRTSGSRLFVDASHHFSDSTHEPPSSNTIRGLGVSDGGSVSPNQMWYIEDRAEKCHSWYLDYFVTGQSIQCGNYHPFGNCWQGIEESPYRW